MNKFLKVIVLPMLLLSTYQAMAVSGEEPKTEGAQAVVQGRVAQWFNSLKDKVRLENLSKQHYIIGSCSVAAVALVGTALYYRTKKQNKQTGQVTA